TRVQGTTDITPILTTGRRLITLNGTDGTGIHVGPIAISNGGTTTTVDLSTAADIGDVINLINAQAPPGVTAGIFGQSITLTASGGANITVKDVGGGTTAKDLGILTLTPGGANVSITGQNVHPLLNPFTDLGSMANGAGINTTGGLTITNGLQTANID